MIGVLARTMTAWKKEIQSVRNKIEQEDNNWDKSHTIGTVLKQVSFWKEKANISNHKALNIIQE